jgi:putative tryptophan/tyrosine transport system substrate-binding protein
VRRRDLLSLGTGGALALAASPFGTRAQQPPRPPLVIFLSFGSANDPRTQAFQQGLRDNGYEDGRNIRVEYVFATSDQVQLRAAEIAARQPAVILGSTSPVVLALMRATQTIPIVAVNVGNPLETGMAASLARPGGNVTGFSLISGDLAAKRVELLKETVPMLTRVAVLANPDNAATLVQLPEALSAGPRLGLEMRVFEARNSDELGRSFAAMAAGRFQAVTVMPDGTFTNLNARITELAAQHALPTIFQSREEATSGGLLSYGPDLSAIMRTSVGYVDRILKGAKPGDLPFQQPTRFLLVVNRRTAKALGLTIPEIVMFRADEVIE